MDTVSPRVVYHNLRLLEHVNAATSAVYRELAQDVLADTSIDLVWRQATPTDSMKPIIASKPKQSARMIAIERRTPTTVLNQFTDWLKRFLGSMGIMVVECLCNEPLQFGNKHRLSKLTRPLNTRLRRKASSLKLHDRLR